MLLINDCIVNEIDKNFKVNTIDYLCRFENIEKLEKILGLTKRLAQNDYFTVYNNNSKCYVIYNASVDDALLNLLDETFCNNTDIKKISPCAQYSLDRITSRLPHKNVYSWENALKRYLILKVKIIRPMTRVKLIAHVKFLNQKALRFKLWKTKILKCKSYNFREFKAMPFAELLSLGSGKSSPLYNKVYNTDHLLIDNMKFSRLSETKRLEAIKQLINTYVLNQYIVHNKDKKFSNLELKEMFIRVIMGFISNQHNNQTIRLYLENNFEKLKSNFDPSFYSIFKSYCKYVKDV